MRAAFSMAPHNAYPGLEFALQPWLAGQLDDFFRLHIRRLLGGRRIFVAAHRCRLGHWQDPVTAAVTAAVDPQTLPPCSAVAPRRRGCGVRGGAGRLAAGVRDV